MREERNSANIYWMFIIQPPFPAEKFREQKGGREGRNKKLSTEKGSQT